MKLLSVMICVAFLFGAEQGAEQDDMPLLRWAGPPGSRPGTYEEWIANNPYTDFVYTLQTVAYGDGRQGTVAILTNQNIANPLSLEVNQLIYNLQAEGYTVYSYQVSGGTPETLRTFLQGVYDSFDIEGALLIGSMPIAWFEIGDDFHQYGYAQFPCDLFYMDLDGTWLDTMNTGNNRYDGHTSGTGDLAPEIYIGRLLPTGLGADTVLINSYLRKDNAYRRDTLHLQERALVFVDDDWMYSGQSFAADVALVYPDTMSFFDPETTRAAIYRQKLDTVQAWVSVFAHSWPGGHQFSFNNGVSHDYYYSYEYTNQNPPANFYNFFCCSFSRYTEDCGGNRAIFNPTSGVGSIGSAKTGSMLNFYYFYLPLSQEKTIGMALKEWFDYITFNNSVTFDELCWHYGMTLLGDPFLKPTGHQLPIAEQQISTGNDLFRLSGNPATDRVTLHGSFPHAYTIKIAMYDCAGRMLTKQEHTVGPGNQTLTIELIDRAGRPLSQGVYIMQVDINNRCFTEKIVKL